MESMGQPAKLGFAWIFKRFFRVWRLRFRFPLVTGKLAGRLCRSLTQESSRESVKMRSQYHMIGKNEDDCLTFSYIDGSP